ncbi:hypothetical protein [Pseudotenacibaculum haliotis]|uniref:Uncharacterized protein n=1 Tax=Pseudotenacibaculum haliotis TaxID=1862138 RepID=A0ABW5LW60_9FLAO
MKNLEKFKLNDSSAHKFMGGFIGKLVKTSDKWKDENGCQVKKTDFFDDCNGDGKWNPGESGQEEIVIEC